nr:MAG TPA: hypothetical protein [Caudoviricetes sp.]
MIKNNEGIQAFWQDLPTQPPVCSRDDVLPFNALRMKQQKQGNITIMEIKRENIIKAYMAGDDSAKKMLRAMFPEIDFEPEKQAEKRPVTERVKTFEDACRELGGEHPFVMAFDSYLDSVHDAYIQDSDIIAYLELRIICAALNEGWEPQFTVAECRWCPWHFLWTEEELAAKAWEWKRSHALIDTGEYRLEEFAGFAFAYSSDENSLSDVNVGSRLCLKSEELSDYCGRQFIELWADFRLIRRK